MLLINHQSFLDPFLVGAPFARPVSYIARDSLFRIPVVGWILRQTYVMPIKRESAGTQSLRESVRRMKHGFLVGLFPEGTRGEPEQLGVFKSGIAHLAKQHRDIPVVPVFMHGLGKTLPRGSVVPVPFYCDVFVGEALYGREDHKAFMGDFTERMQALAAEGKFAVWD